MIAGEFGLDRDQLTRFEEAYLLLQEVVEAEGVIEFDKVETHCFTEGDGTKKVTDDFKTPLEDNTLFSERWMPRHGRVIMKEGKGYFGAS
jgi:predicted nucleic acid-binding protein